METILVEAKAIQYEQPALPAADNCVIVIFGATGDLTRRKLMPALFQLMQLNCLLDFQIIGVGRNAMTVEDFRQQMHAAVQEFTEAETANENDWRRFEQHLSYLSGELDQDEVYANVAKVLEQLVARGASRNRLFYLATPPSLAPDIVRGVGEARLATEDQGWARIVVEKPFGSDLESAKKLNADILRVFKEKQVYRIDHYLGKDTVQNILVFRFGNSMFEPIWNRNYVEYVEISAAEALGVGTRAGYYEEAGALRDMVANHLLQLLSLTAMEPPVAFDSESVREEKVQVLRSIPRFKPEEVSQRTVRAQYTAGTIDGEQVKGYREEQGVAPGSNTETYVAVEFGISNWRWAGVPFYVRTGKHLGRSLTEVAIHLKRTPQALFSKTPDDLIEPNVIVLRIQPNEGITVTFGAKRPGSEMHTSTVHMDFCYQTAFGVRSPDAYQTLLLDVMRGDATLFIRRDEVEAQWRLITPIEEAWAEEKPPRLSLYAAGSDGPAAADEMIARCGHHWRALAASRAGCD